MEEFETKVLDARGAKLITALYAKVPGTDVTVEWKPMRGWHVVAVPTPSWFDAYTPR